MADPLKKPPGSPVKGKPLGIPMWGWMIAAALGIVIGYTILKQSKSASATDSQSGISSADGSAIPPDKEDKGSGAGMPPLEDILSALGLRGSTSVSPGGDSSSNGGGDSLATAPEESSTTTTEEPQFPLGGLENPRTTNPLYVDPYGDTTRFPSVELTAMSEALNKKYGLGEYATPERTTQQSPTSMPGSTAVSTSTPVSPGGAGTRMNIPM